MPNRTQSCQYVVAKGPTASATTAVSGYVDCATYSADYVTFVVPVNAEANTNSTNVVVTISHGDTTNSYTTLGTGTIDNTSANVGVFHVATVGRQRYFKCAVTPDTTTNGAVIPGGIIAIVDPDFKGATADSTSSVVVI